MALATLIWLRPTKGLGGLSLAGFLLLATSALWIPRDGKARLKRSAKTRPVIVLTGARQTGGGVVSRTPNSFPFPNGFRASPVTELR
jgi:hypothetical protein